MATVLEIRNVSHSFRAGFLLKKVEVLHGIELKVPEKSIFGFLGANGAGKTTLIQLVAGLRNPTQGVVKVFGSDASSVNARAKLGYLPEKPYFYSHLSAVQMLRFLGELSGMRGVKLRSRVPQVLNAVGLKDIGDLEVKHFSKGMLQRLGIAQALIHDPEFLVLDEPMSGLDPLGRKEMRELIRFLAQEGRTIFFSSHIIPDVEVICDQIGLIQAGRLIGCGPIGQFLARGLVRTEVAFRGVQYSEAKDWEDFSELSEIQGGLRGLVPGQDAVDRVIRRLIKKDARILWITPIRPSLENLFSSEREQKK